MGIYTLFPEKVGSLKIENGRIMNSFQFFIFIREENLECPHRIHIGIAYPSSSKLSSACSAVALVEFDFIRIGEIGIKDPLWEM